MSEILLRRISTAFQHPTDINEPLTAVEIAGMTFAGTTLSVLQVVINVFISYYYTNVVGLSAALVGTLLLLTRIADAISDLGMGIIITKTSSNSGKARPWAIRMALPLFVSVVLAFFVPARWDTTSRTIYACVTYFFMITIAVTPAGIVGSVLGTTMTSNSHSRQKNSVIFSIFMMIGIVAGTVATQKITEAGGDSYEIWRTVAIGFGLLAALGQVVQYIFTRERGIGNFSDNKKANDPTLKQSLPALYKNKYFIIMCLVGVFTAIDSAMSGCIMYYFKYVLNNTGLVGIVSGVTLVSTIFGIGLVPVITRRVPQKHLILLGLAIKAATFIINVLFPENLALFIVFAAIRSVAGSPMMVYSGVYLLNTIEYGEYKTGIRANSLIVTVSSIGSKIGSGIGSGLIGWLLGLSGYVGTATVQRTQAQNMIIYIYFLIPLVAAAAQFSLLSFYNLDKKHEQIVQILKERQAVTA